MATLTPLPRVAVALAALAATALPMRGELRTGNRFAIEAETVDGGGGTATSARYSVADSVAPAAVGASEAGTTKILHGFVSVLTIAKVTAYDGWALARGLTIGVNAGFFDDPNHDGIPNIRHFAFDSDPLGQRNDEDKRVLSLVEIGGLDYLTLTLPVRSGVTFAGTPLLSTSVDGVSYEILGTTGLNVPWTLPVVELVPPLDSGLPALGDFDAVPGSDWSYRTFRLTDPVGSSPRQFMKAGVSAAP